MHFIISIVSSFYGYPLANYVFFGCPRRAPAASGTGISRGSSPRVVAAGRRRGSSGVGSIVFAKLTAAIEDGRISRQEAAELRVEADSALAACAGLRDSLDKRLERADPPERPAPRAPGSVTAPNAGYTRTGRP